MKLSECSFCGLHVFTENGVCSSCQAAMNPDAAKPPAQNNQNFSQSIDSTPPQNSAPPNSPPANSAPMNFAPTNFPQTNFAQTNFAQTNSAPSNFPPPNSPPRFGARSLPPPSSRAYTRVECWKCKTVHNWETDKICTSCGCALRLHPREESNLKGDPILSSPGVRMFIRMAFVLALIVGGITYWAKYPTAKTDGFTRINSKEAAPPEEITLPPNSWYQPSIWNFYRDNPTVEEVLKKNTLASGEMSSEDFQTMCMKGNLSFAEGDCMTDKCSQIIADRANAEDRYTMGRYKGYSPQNYTKNSFKISKRDDFDTRAYQDAGRLEGYVKKPDKVLRKVSVRFPKQSKKTETVEGFDGVKGWKKTVTYENEARIENTIKDLMGFELEDLKNSTSMMEKDYSDKGIKFSSVKKVKQKVHFVLNIPKADKTDSYYFDAVTGLLTKIDSQKSTCYLTDYADYNGLKLPSALYFRTITDNGFAVWMKIENIEWYFNEPMSDAMFAKPVE